MNLLQIETRTKVTTTDPYGADSDKLRDSRPLNGEDNLSRHYTLASTFPVKLLQADLMDDKGRLQPLHLVVTPTNRCNIRCSFCSSDDRDMDAELSLEELKDIVIYFKSIGTRAVTITGGGDPSLHPAINEFIDFSIRNDIKVGMATNGILIHELNHKLPMSWLRISLSDECTLTPRMSKGISSYIKKMPETDVSVSYVYTDVCRMSSILDAIEKLY